MGIATLQIVGKQITGKLVRMHDLASDRRNFQRVLIEAPVDVDWADGSQRRARGRSRNVTAEGIFFLMDTEIEETSRVELRLHLPSRGALDGDVVFWCVGRVVRTERLDGKIGVAVALDEVKIAPARNAPPTTAA